MQALTLAKAKQLKTDLSDHSFIVGEIEQVEGVYIVPFNKVVKNASYIALFKHLQSYGTRTYYSPLVGSIRLSAARTEAGEYDIRYDGKMFSICLN